MREVAARLLQNERDGHTLQPTDLVHEAYLRAQKREKYSDLDPAAARMALAQEMRWVLVDYARVRNAKKRGGPNKPLRVTLDEALIGEEIQWVEVLELNRVLDQLETVDPDTVRMVELRFYGGLTEEEVAEHFGLSRRTVQKRWAWAKGWLRRRLS